MNCPETPEAKNKRKQRTRMALIQAFNALVFENSGREIRVADIIAKAKVGRSTFYEHFANANDLHMQALSHPMSILADAIVGTKGSMDLVWLLEHFQENQQRARESFTGPHRQTVSRVLITLLNERLTHDTDNVTLPKELLTLNLAEASLGMIRAWIFGDVWCSASELAEAICQTSQNTLSNTRQNLS